MSPQLKPILKFETTWIREWARTYDDLDASFVYPPALLRHFGASLIDVRNVFRFGSVVFADKLDGPGAIWQHEGEDCDDRFLGVWTQVVSQEYRVIIHGLERRSA